VEINPGLFKVELTDPEPYGVKLGPLYYRSSYYAQMLSGNYTPGQEKSYVFRVMLLNRSLIDFMRADRLNISAGFGGYGVSRSSGKLHVVPLYSAAERTYEVVLNNAEVCKKIVDAELGKKCQKLYLPPTVDTLGECDGANHGEARRLCYAVVAERENDLELCEKNHNELLQDACYSVLAAKQEKPGICQKIFDTKRRASCYGHLGIEQDASIVCAGLSDNYQVTECYIALGEFLTDPNECETIRDPTDNAFCYLGYIRALMNRGATEEDECKIIRNMDRRDECYDFLGQRFNSTYLCSKAVNENTIGEWHDSFNRSMDKILGSI